ncbi:hypothetical protein BOX15_Mlig013167g6 [Macrostomum lignano]|uniref:Uncharacterized protein n=1 Tax=Macrostomum lignano TaxID=282301 RepID=A0A267GEE9_9PLAT|nr:hypothetical protein BOX15_Mlig013167g6 [Macrostomum lignano]
MENEFEKILTEIRDAETHAATERSRSAKAQNSWQSLRQAVEDEVSGLRQLAGQIVRLRAELTEAANETAAYVAEASGAASRASGVEAALREAEAQRAVSSAHSFEEFFVHNDAACRLLDRLMNSGDSMRSEAEDYLARLEAARSALDSAQLEEARLHTWVKDFAEQKARLAAARAGCAEQLDLLSELEQRLDAADV